MTKHQAIQHIRDILRIFKNTDPYLVINVLGTNGTPVKRVLEIPHGTVESFQHHCAVFSEESKNLKVTTSMTSNMTVAQLKALDSEASKIIHSVNSTVKKRSLHVTPARLGGWKVQGAHIDPNASKMQSVQ